MIRRLLAVLGPVALAACSGSQSPAQGALPPVPVITGLPANGVILARHEGTASMESDFGAAPSWSVTGGTIVEGQGTIAIRFLAGDPGTLSLTASLRNAAGARSATRNLAVVPAPGAPKVQSPSFVLANTPGATAVADTAVVWSVSAGAEMTSAPDAGVLTWKATAPGTVVITATAANRTGDDASSTYAVTVGAAGLQVLAGKPGGLGFVDGAASEARLLTPTGLVSDGDGGVYISDYTTVRRYANGSVQTVAGRVDSSGDCAGTGVSSILPQVSGIARDESGNLYVSGAVYTGSLQGVICKIDPSGAVTRLAYVGSGVDGLAYGAGKLAAVRAGVVTEVALDGGVIATAGVADAVTGWQTQGVAVLADGGVVISGLMGSQAALATVEDGATTRLYGTDTTWPRGCGFPLLCMPEGIAPAPDGSLLVADVGNFALWRYDGAQMHLLAGIPGTYGSADGPAAIATFGRLQAVAVEPSGSVVLADDPDGLLRRMDTGGTVSTLAGVPSGAGTVDGPGVSARLTLPSAIAVGADGTIFVAELNGRIVRITASGIASTLATVGPTTHLAAGPGGTLLASLSDSTVWSISSTGQMTRVAGTGSPGYAEGDAATAQFGAFKISSSQVSQDYAGGALAFDGVDAIYVADADNLRVRVIRQGQVSTFASLPDQPEGVAVSGGDLYVLAGRTRVERWSAAGTRKALIPIDYVYLGSLAVDDSGAVYVSNPAFHKVQVISSGGQARTLAGSASVLGVRPGPLPGALAGPAAIAIAPSGAPNAGVLALAEFADNAVVLIRP